MKGRIIPISEASIPINDWGLVHSDITYDVVPVWNGSFFRIDDYLDRFEASMAALRLDPKINRLTEYIIVLTKEFGRYALPGRLLRSKRREGPSYDQRVC